MVDDPLARHRNGYVAELKAKLYYAEHGYDIYEPSFSQSAVDFIAVNNKVSLRIQVKKAYWMERPSGMRYLQATVRKGSGGYKAYTDEDCDLIVIVHEDEMWIIPVADVNGQQTIVVGRGQEIRRPDPRAFNPAPFKVL